MSHDTHFLRRLERVSPLQADMALALYRDPQLVRFILTDVRLPDGAERVALALEDGPTPPHVIVARDGSFVTCLGAGMKISDTPVVNREQIDRISAKWNVLTDTAARLREQGDLGKVYRRLFSKGRNVSREDMLSMSFIQPLLWYELIDTITDLNELLVEFRSRYKPRRYRRLTEKTREELHAYWKLSWALGHLVAINGDHIHRLLDMMTPLFQDEPDMEMPHTMTWPATRTMMQGIVLRGSWLAARGGKRILPSSKRVWEKAASWTQFVGSTLALMAIGMRHRRLRAEVAKILARRTSPILDSTSEFHEPGAPLLLDLCEKVIEPQTQEAMSQMHRGVGAEKAVQMGQALPEDHPLRFTDPEAVPDELACPLFCGMDGSLYRRVRRVCDCILLLPWLANTKLEELYLPAKYLPVYGTPCNPEALVEQLDSCQWYYGKLKPARAPDKVGRNDSCPCGSGKKSKRCCGG